jgi:plastocyanin
LIAIGYASAQQAATTHTIVIKAMKYQPAELEVRVGDTVEWKNEDFVAHTVTARDKSFDSGKIAPGSSWKITLNKAGTIDYGCVPHPNMKGRLVVK